MMIHGKNIVFFLIVFTFIIFSSASAVFIIEYHIISDICVSFSFIAYSAECLELHLCF